MTTLHVCVLGAGIVGLSSALATLDALPDASLTVIAHNFTPNTTSDGAFGLWEPHCINQTPAEDVRRWGGLTLDHMMELANSPDGPMSGTFTLSGYYLYKSHMQDPLWKDLVPSFRHMKPHELQQYGPEFIHGWAFTTAVTESRFYLGWLTEKLRQRGVVFQKAKITDLSKLAGKYDVIVNCTGLGSRDLVKDDHVTPVRGQVIRVTAPWVKHFVVSEQDQLNIFPGIDSVVLGSCNEPGAWGTEVDIPTRDRILAGCRRLMPSLKNAKIMYDWAGLRPSRTRVRLEADIVQTSKGMVKVVHNYGHGGAGITLHWGCALEAADLIKQLLKTAKL